MLSRLLLTRQRYPLSSWSTIVHEHKSFRIDHTLLTIHNLLHGNHASALGVHGQSHNGYSNRYFVIAGKSGGRNAATAMVLRVAAAASIILAFRTAASARKTGRSGLHRGNRLVNAGHDTVIHIGTHGFQRTLQQTSMLRQHNPIFPEQPKQSEVG